MPADPTRGEERKDAAEVLADDAFEFMFCDGELSDNYASLEEVRADCETLAAAQLDALFASLPPDSDHLVIRRSDRAVMGLEETEHTESVNVMVGPPKPGGCDWRREDWPLYRLVARGSPTVGEEGNDGD